jgi:hypothetical protein
MYVILLLFQDLTAEMKLEDFTGKSLLAIEVFGLSIQALKSHMMNALEKEGTKIKPHEIRWVLTVPAIWPESAKQFMRKSAERVFRFQQIKIIYYYHMKVDYDLISLIKAFTTVSNKAVLSFAVSGIESK